MFVSSDDSDDSVGNGKDDVIASTDINTRSVGTSADINTRGFGTSIDTTQETLDRKLFLLLSVTVDAIQAFA